MLNIWARFNIGRHATIVLSGIIEMALAIVLLDIAPWGMVLARVEIPVRGRRRGKYLISILLFLGHGGMSYGPDGLEALYEETLLRCRRSAVVKDSCSAMLA